MLAGKVKTRILHENREGRGAQTTQQIIVVATGPVCHFEQMRLGNFLNIG